MALIVEQPTSTLALKEWAVAVKALGEGTQIITIRKGGLYEETREFKLEHNKFYLYPTYEHQKAELVKPAYQRLLVSTLEGWTLEQSTVDIEYFAEVTDDVELLDEEKLRALSPYHIWTDTFADVRLRWKRKQPLHILFVRMYRLAQQITIPIDVSYQGCKSWHQLLPELPKVGFQPVLSDEEYTRQKAAIMELINT